MTLPSSPVLTSTENADEEHLRLRELAELRILDTPAEARFDRYTRLVADVFDVPTVKISFIDRDRQWLKSAYGAELCETPRHITFCTHALSEKLLEVPDAREDPRFHDNPFVTGAPHIRFYAGAVLHGPAGRPLGALCLVDYAPRRLSAAERERLLCFAHLVEQEINIGSRDRSTLLPDLSLIRSYLGSLVCPAVDEPRPVSIVHLRVSSFDSVTALHGRAGGEALLREIAHRLRSVVRESDIIGRSGLNRFLLVLPGINHHEGGDERIRRLLDQMTAPVRIGSTPLQLRLQAGVSSYPTDADTLDEVLDCAQSALQDTALDHGPVTCYFYSRETHERTRRRHDTTHRLAEAIKAGCLQQVYQPITTLHRHKITAVEALARWHDPDYGPVSPAEFIPLAEADAGLRRAITRWSLEAACRQARSWNHQLAEPIAISVNIPGGELYREDFVDLIRGTLKAYGTASEHIMLELTEQSLITNLPTATAAIEELRADGVRFAIDDFGTGYSSLSYLQKLPLDAVKIDRSFIQHIADDAIQRELTASIFAICRTLNLRIIAEGVETAAQYDALQALKCDAVQGYLLGRPTTAAAVTTRLNIQARSSAIKSHRLRAFRRTRRYENCSHMLT